MTKLLYQSGNWFCILHSYFLDFMETTFSDVTTKTLRHYVCLILAMLVDETAYSVRTLYFHTLCKIGYIGLSTYYMALARAGKGDHLPLPALAPKGIKLADKKHPEAPFLLAIDDTTIKKFGKHFYGVGMLFDHSSHEKQKYINGHCFVSVCLQVPVSDGDGEWFYQPIPLGFKLWVPKETSSKLDIACDLIKQVMDVVGKERNVVIVCDSWYTKSNLLQLTKAFPNLHLVGNVRSDTACREYDAPEKDPHKRGKAPAHGDKLSLDDYILSKDTLNNFHVGYRKVAITMLKGQPLWAYVSAPSLKSKSKSKRLFLSSIDPMKLAGLLKGYARIPSGFNNSHWECFSPMLVYAERWHIEVFFENMKTFWSLTEYKVRNENAIPRYLNLICLAYTGITLLPYDEDYPQFSQYKGLSPQELRLIISTRLKEELCAVERIEAIKAMEPSDVRKNPLMMAEYSALHEKVDQDITRDRDQTEPIFIFKNARARSPLTHDMPESCYAVI